MLSDRYANHLEELKNAGLYRQLRCVSSASGRTILLDHHPRLVFCANNYLGLAADPRVAQAVSEAVKQWGWGAGASRLISGNLSPHEQLQNRLAQFLGKEAALVFPSGYATNTAVLNTLVGENDLVVMDKLSHASLIDGARMCPGTLRTYPHGQPNKLRRLLEKGGYEQAFIVTDSLFSMDGDFAPLAELVDIKKQFRAVLMIDEAHAFGCLGPDGRGLAAEQGLLAEVDIFIATFSKALGGSGGFVACDRVIADYLINHCRGFIYTTAIPAANCAAAWAALDIIAAEPQRRQRLLGHADALRQRCRDLGLDIGPSASYIIPVIIGSAEKTMAAAEELYRRGFLVGAIRPPTVPPGGSRLRISLMSEHTHKDLDGLCAALKDLNLT